jgi:DNA-binding NarL/FixJ family response regulator
MTPEAQRGERDMVLVVDDNVDELKLLVDAIEQADITALAATSGEGALALLASVLPHAVVLDARMGGIDGFETCRRLKQEARFGHLPVIFLTGLTDTEHVLMGLQAGGVDYVTKPVIIAELIARIRIHIANARAALGAQIGLDASGRHLLAVDRQGHLTWCTPQAAQLIAWTFGKAAGGDLALPPELAGRLAGAATTGESELGIGTPPHRVVATYLCESGPNESLFRLVQAANDEETLARAFALTAREAEVLLWMARGKSNHDISDILGISARTVDKHAERLFSKLGVENRTAAASQALGVLAARG